MPDRCISLRASYSGFHSHHKLELVNSWELPDNVTKECRDRRIPQQSTHGMDGSRKPAAGKGHIRNKSSTICERSRPFTQLMMQPET